MFDYEIIKGCITEYMGCGCKSCRDFFLEERKVTVEDMQYMDEEFLEKLLEK